MYVLQEPVHHRTTLSGVTFDCRVWIHAGSCRFPQPATVIGQEVTVARNAEVIICHGTLSYCFDITL